MLTHWEVFLVLICEFSRKDFITKIGSIGVYKIAASLGDLSATAMTYIVYVDKGPFYHPFVGKTDGILLDPKIKTSYTMDSIFLPKGCLKTYGEMNSKELEIHSNQGKALRKLINFLKFRK